MPFVHSEFSSNGACDRPTLLKHNPLEGYPAPGKDRKGSRILSDEELVRVWNACEGSFGDMIRLIILWGCQEWRDMAVCMPQWRDGST